MKKYLPFAFAFLVLLVSSYARGQIVQSDSSTTNCSIKPFGFALPLGFIAAGFMGMESRAVKNVNISVKTTLTDNMDEHYTIDDFIQLSGPVTVYSLNLVGVKGKHNFKDRTLLLGSSFAIMATSVLGLKATTKVQRPDESSNNSFPSGHTATAFLGAEFLYQEYKNYPLLWVSGYAIATTTGFFRVYNQRHWITDVTTGAGIGLLSTKLAYFIYPKIRHAITHKNSESVSGFYILPQINGHQTMLAISITF